MSSVLKFLNMIGVLKGLKSGLEDWVRNRALKIPEAKLNSYVTDLSVTFGVPEEVVRAMIIQYELKIQDDVVANLYKYLS